MTPREAQIVALARQWLDTPYRHQASCLGAGCDCLGLVRGIWRTLYGHEPVALPPYRPDWRDKAHADGLVRAAQTLLRREVAPAAGRVVLFSFHRGLPAKHCGVLVAPDRFIHAQERLGVVEAALTPGWQRRVAGIYSFP